MFKLLIADDEMHIREGLKHVFDWKDLGFSAVETAADGEEAMEIASKFKPDLCLIDINMPGLNGLDLIEKLNNENPLGINIIITGFDEFKYTNRAIKLGVFDYVLKPVEEPALLQIVLKARDKIKNEQGRRRLLSLAEKQIEKNMPILRDRFLREWIDGLLSDEEIKELLNFHNLQLQGGLGLLLVSAKSEDYVEQGQYEKIWQLNSFALQEIIRGCLKPFFPCLITTDHQDNIVAIASNADYEKWQTVAADIENAIGTQLTLKCCVFSVDAPNGYAQVNHAYSSLLSVKETEEGYNLAIKKIINYVKLHYHDPQLGLGFIANEFGWSVGHLSRVFKKETGLPFIDFLIKIRISEAGRLLSQTDLKIYEISEKVGYSSQHYFCAGFKRVLGVSPSEYRTKG